MKTEFLSETLVMKSLVEDSVINGTRRERRREIIFVVLFIIFLLLFKSEIKNFYFKRNLISKTKIDENLTLNVYRPFNFGVSGEITSYYVVNNKEIYLGTCDEKEFFQAKKIYSSRIEVIKYSRRNMFGKGVRVIDSVQINLK